MPNWRRVVKRRKLVATKPGHRKIVNVRFPLRCVPTPAWQTSADKGAVRDKSKLGVNDGRLTNLSGAPEGAEYLRSVLRAPV